MSKPFTPTPAITKQLYLTLLALLVLAITALPAIAKDTNSTSRPNQRLFMHEWGILTQVVAVNGSPMFWQPLQTLPVEPDFVAQYPINPTPVWTGLQVPAIFFRVDKPLDISLSITSLAGWFTSSYPQGRVSNHQIDWPTITLLPQSPVALPQGNFASRYDVARQPASAYVRVDSLGHKQFERFIWLRGQGRYHLPITLSNPQGKYMLARAKDAAIPTIFWIQNSAGQLGFEALPFADDQPLELPKLDLNQSPDLLSSKLTHILMQQGLYPDEASAAVAGVKSSWLEPGMRVIYFLPQSWADTLFTLELTPKPSDHKRVYAVRIEIIPSALRQTCLETLTKLNIQDDTACHDFLSSSPWIRPTLLQLQTLLSKDPAPSSKATLLKIDSLLKRTPSIAH